jgi:hypothetical protein
MIPCHSDLSRGDLAFLEPVADWVRRDVNGSNQLNRARPKFSWGVFSRVQRAACLVTIC